MHLCYNIVTDPYRSLTPDGRVLCWRVATVGNTDPARVRDLTLGDTPNVTWQEHRQRGFWPCYPDRDRLPSKVWYTCL